MKFATWGAVMLMLGVTFGAFGAHALKAHLDTVALGWWQTGVDYQMWTGAGLFALGLTSESRGHNTLKRRGGYLLCLGICIFSGSLYCMALTGHRWLGAVTPIGGCALIFGWAALALAFRRSKDADQGSEMTVTDRER